MKIRTKDSASVELCSVESVEWEGRCFGFCHHWMVVSRGRGRRAIGSGFLVGTFIVEERICAGIGIGIRSEACLREEGSGGFAEGGKDGHLGCFDFKGLSGLRWIDFNESEGGCLFNFVEMMRESVWISLSWMGVRDWENEEGRSAVLVLVYSVISLTQPGLMPCRRSD